MIEVIEVIEVIEGLIEGPNPAGYSLLGSVAFNPHCLICVANRSSMKVPGKHQVIPLLVCFFFAWFAHVFTVNLWRALLCYVV